MRTLSEFVQTFVGRYAFVTGREEEGALKIGAARVQDSVVELRVEGDTADDDWFPAHEARLQNEV